MFDWNDEEISNIIWGEANECDDHIVPHLEAGNNFHDQEEWHQEVLTIKPTERKTDVPKIDGPGTKLDGSPNLTGGISASGFDMESWPSLSSSNATKTDLDPLGTKVSKDLTKITNYDSMKESAPSAKDPEIFQDPDEGKEQCDFVDYGWANIGSFDDLDRIFSNDDPVFGTVNLGNADELWSSSKDVISSPMKSFPVSAGSPSSALGILKSASEQFETKKEHVEVDDKSCTLGYGKPEIPASHGLQNAQAILNTGEHAGGENMTKEKDKKMDLNLTARGTAINPQLVVQNVRAPNEFSDQYVQHNKQKKLLRSRKKLDIKNDCKFFQDVYGNWTLSKNPSGQFGNQFLSSTVQSSPPSVLSQQRQIQGSEAFQYSHNPSSYVAPSGYGDAASSFSVIPVTSHVQPEKLKHQALLSGYEVPSVSANPVNKSGDARVISKTMTPQEKIEKLRRRQQMQALLAIQKQQQQLGHQASTTDHAITQKCTQENEIQHFDGADLVVEDLGTLSSLDPNSPVEQDDSSTISLAVNDYAVEDKILFRLQDTVAKLDMTIRLCIRDSLFRLAQSAMQRHYASDTSTWKHKDERVSANGDINNSNRSADMADVETETNPIDRTVAHLLFYRPVELSEQNPDTPGSPVSPKLPCDLKSIAVMNSSTGHLAERSKNKQNFSLQGTKNSGSLLENQLLCQYKSSPCLDTSENASNNGHVDKPARNIEASQ